MEELINRFTLEDVIEAVESIECSAFVMKLQDLPNMSVPAIEHLIGPHMGPFSLPYMKLSGLTTIAKILKFLVTKYNKEENPKLITLSGKKFIKFPKLPVELRRKVWVFAFPGPRVIEIFAEKVLKKNVLHGKESTLITTGRLRILKAIHVKLVSLLQVCKESRGVVKSQYSTLNAAGFGINTLPAQSVFMFNPAIDNLYIKGHDLLGATPATFINRQQIPFLSEIRTLSLHTSTFFPIKVNSPFVKYYLPRMTKLEKLFFVMGDNAEIEGQIIMSGCKSDNGGPRDQGTYRFFKEFVVMVQKYPELSRLKKVFVALRELKREGVMKRTFLSEKLVKEYDEKYSYGGTMKYGYTIDLMDN